MELEGSILLAAQHAARVPSKLTSRFSAPTSAPSTTNNPPTPTRSLPQPDPTLKRLLDSIPHPKYIFTNADIKHADRCLALLGIADCFDGVIAFEQVMQAAEEAGLAHHGCPVVCKPNRQSFDIALRLAGGAQASTTLWLDDRWVGWGSGLGC